MREFDFVNIPIVDIVNDIIVDGATKNASDIHFDPAENYLKIRMRIDGELRDYAIIDNKYKRNLITRVKLLAGMNITESRLPQDGAIKSNINGKDLDLRVADLPTSFGEKIVIRILDYTMSFQGIESLGFTNENYKIIEQMLNMPNGIILVTGATGSGKSTTVYSMLQRLNVEGTNIITVEDPVEMNIEGINQVQVNSEIGLDFAAVLRSILREDPNVILIGEIRDSETAKIAIRASITGHLVLSTLHTNNSITTIERLIDMGVERYLLSSSLKGIISQTLAKKLCPHCRKERPTTEVEKRIFKKVLNKDVDNIYESVGCPECRNGYRGRISLQEVLLINDEIRDAINDQINRADLKKLIYKKDVKTLLQDGLIKVIEGTTSIEEVFKLVDAADDVDNLYTEDNKNEKPIEEKKEHNILNNDIDLNKILENNNDIINKNEKTINNPTSKPINNITNEISNAFEPKYNIDDIIHANTNEVKEQPIKEQPTTEEVIKQKPTQIENITPTNNYTDDLIKLIDEGFFQ